MSAALKIAHEDEESVSQLPIMWSKVLPGIASDEKGEAITATHWVQRSYTNDAVAMDWRKDCSMMDTGTKQLSAPPDAQLFNTGCANTLQDPSEKIASSRAEVGTLATVDDTATGRAHLLKQMLVRSARATMSFCIGFAIEEPNDQQLTLINTNIRRDFGDSAPQLSKEQVLTWVFHEKMITQAFAQAIRAKMTVYQRVNKDLLDLIKFHDTRYEQTFAGSTPVGAALLMLRHIVLNANYTPTAEDIGVLTPILDLEHVRVKRQKQVTVSTLGGAAVTLTGMHALVANMNISTLVRIKDRVGKKLPRRGPAGEGVRAAAKRKRVQRQEELGDQMVLAVAEFVLGPLSNKVLKALHEKKQFALTKLPVDTATKADYIKDLSQAARKACVLQLLAQTPGETGGASASGELSE